MWQVFLFVLCAVLFVYGAFSWLLFLLLALPFTAFPTIAVFFPRDGCPQAVIQSVLDVVFLECQHGSFLRVFDVSCQSCNPVDLRMKRFS